MKTGVTSRRDPACYHFIPISMKTFQRVLQCVLLAWLPVCCTFIAGCSRLGATSTRSAFCSRIRAIELVPVAVNGNVALIDQYGNVIIATEYAGILPFSDTHVVVVEKREGFPRRLLNLSEGQVLPPCYEFIFPVPVGEHLGLVRKNAKYGYVTDKGRMVVPAVYSKAEFFACGVAAVENGKVWKYIDEHGQSAFAGEFQKARSFSEHWAAVRIADKWGYINRNGVIVIPPMYGDAYDFSEGLAPVRVTENAKYGYINTNGHFVIRAQYDCARGFYQGVAGVMVKGEWGCIDRTGKYVVPPEYDQVEEGSEGLIPARKSAHWGYVSQTSGQVAIPFVFECAWKFQYGLAPVKVHGKYGYINKQGDMVIAAQYRRAGPFRTIPPVAAVETGTEMEPLQGYINTNGAYIWRPTR